MAEPLFKLQLVYPDGSTIRFKGASKFERNLVEAITKDIVQRVMEPIIDAVRVRGVGIGRSEAHVLMDVADALREKMPELVEEGVKAVLYNLKEETVRLV